MNFGPPVGDNGLDATFGHFGFHELSGGNVAIDTSWQMQNLRVLHDVCGTGKSVQLHNLVADGFEEALLAALASVPTYPVRMLGGFCARHKMHNPARSLSVHSWGAAFDINWDSNLVAKPLVTDLPPDFILAFTSRGWEWGGDWKNEPDAMHFQYARGV